MSGKGLASLAGLYTYIPTLFGLVPKLVTCCSEPAAPKTPPTQRASVLKIAVRIFEMELLRKEEEWDSSSPRSPLVSSVCLIVDNAGD